MIELNRGSGRSCESSQAGGTAPFRETFAKAQGRWEQRKGEAIRW